MNWEPIIILAAVALVVFWVWHETPDYIGRFWPRDDERGGSDE